MPRRTKEDAQKTRSQILTSALTLFVKNGYERTTFTDIAAALKLTKGAVYWHFKTKEDLLLALVEVANARFEERITSKLHCEELSFCSITDLMVEIAARVVSDSKARAFFLFLRTQVKWGLASMKAVRDNLMNTQQNCPFKAIARAVQNDQAAGRVRLEVNANETASICIAVWDGLVQGAIDGFLEYDLTQAVRHAFDAVWLSIKK